jgi:hypothetical protein
MNVQGGLQYLRIVFFAPVVAAAMPVTAQTDSQPPDIDAAIQQVSNAADEVKASSNDLSRAADRLRKALDSDHSSAANPAAHIQTCTVDRELISLGAALTHASGALKLIEPMLLHTSSYNLFDALQGKPSDVEAFQGNLRRSRLYGAALDKIANAGKELTTLDPLGSTGPPSDTVQLMTQGGQSLVDLAVVIGLHIRRIGETMATVRIATDRHDQPMCPDAVMSQMVGLAGEDLSVSLSGLYQVDALHMIGVALYDMSLSVPNPPVESLRAALNFYKEALEAEALALANVGTIADNIKLPPAAAGAAGSVRELASRAQQTTTILRSIATHVADARDALSVDATKKPPPSRVILRHAGQALSQVPDLKETGGALIRAGDLMSVGQSQAAEVLRNAAVRLVSKKAPVRN